MNLQYRYRYLSIHFLKNKIVKKLVYPGGIGLVRGRSPNDRARDPSTRRQPTKSFHSHDRNGSCFFGFRHPPSRNANKKTSKSPLWSDRRKNRINGTATGIMDPERVRAYLQVACAGLGFDIGEVWWTSNENGSSTVAAIGEYGIPWSRRVPCFPEFGRKAEGGRWMGSFLGAWGSLIGQDMSEKEFEWGLSTGLTCDHSIFTSEQRNPG